MEATLGQAQGHKGKPKRERESSLCSPFAGIGPITSLSAGTCTSTTVRNQSLGGLSLVLLYSAAAIYRCAHAESRRRTGRRRILHELLRMHSSLELMVHVLELPRISSDRVPQCG